MSAAASPERPRPSEPVRRCHSEAAAGEAHSAAPLAGSLLLAGSRPSRPRRTLELYGSLPRELRRHPLVGALAHAPASLPFGGAAPTSPAPAAARSAKLVTRFERRRTSSEDDAPAPADALRAAMRCALLRVGQDAWLRARTAHSRAKTGEPR